ncbi:MAG: hypothetical protein K2X27_02710 [Candidatus Obscuribacterales bacterium]|nr:hypothetical protein [Candidatus Obscuribacterales bacterium]
MILIFISALLGLIGAIIGLGLKRAFFSRPQSSFLTFALGAASPVLLLATLLWLQGDSNIDYRRVALVLSVSGGLGGLICLKVLKLFSQDEDSSAEALEAEPIYTITLCENEGKSPRPVGWFHSLEEARRAIQSDAGHMSSYRYSYAVLEELLPGVYCQVKSQVWYVFRKDSWQREKKTPDWAQGICNWALG